MKLFEVPRNSTVILPDGEELYFYHIDGMYSLCKTKEGEPIHLAAWTEVTVKEEPLYHAT